MNFFAEYFPAYRSAQFLCESYLMEPKLLLFLKPDSNIARFQSLFDIVETFDDDS